MCLEGNDDDQLLLASLPHHWTLTSVVLLPLKNLKASAIEAKVLVCGGALKSHGDMVLLRNSNIWLINDAELETAGWE
ncbi:hypothetical protein J1N35_033895 [Gossypium stocksii]|uniref:Uncharacterized protein n=1 Tax=Gossypium stocksii TaxID=47602 RepID=A0A9D3UR09_9ROSI|nr:hypothetical protein J1N35_033895 [Gossypium stocksii]